MLDPGFARHVARSAGLRNRLVHEYEEIDSARVFAALGEALVDIPRYLEAVNRHVSGAV